MRTARNTESRTQQQHDAPPAHGDKIFDGPECVAVIECRSGLSIPLDDEQR